jgi:hypothetical protein
LLVPKNAWAPVTLMLSLSHPTGMKSTAATLVTSRQATSTGSSRATRRA